MKITIITTKHNTTKEEQWEKCLEELIEFSQELCKHNSIRYNKRFQNAEPVVNEGIDVIKSLSKWGGMLHEYNIFALAGTTSFYCCLYEKALKRLREHPDRFVAKAVVYYLLVYLVKFSQENNLDFEQMLKEHDERLKKRGVKMKIYIDEGDIKTLQFCYDTFKQKDTYIDVSKRLKRIIDEVEK